MTLLPTNKVNPNHAPEPIIPAIPLKDLPRYIERAKAILADHKARRPSNSEIQALTVWAQEKDILAGRLEVLEAQSRASWREVPVPGIPPPQPLPEPTPAAVTKPRTPHPAPPTKPTPEVPMPRVAKPPQEQLDYMLKDLDVWIKKLGTAADQKVFLKTRQAGYWKRAEIVKFARTHGRVQPRVPEMPPDPWGKKALKPPALAPGMSPRVPALLGLPEGLKFCDLSQVMSYLNHTTPKTSLQRLETLGLALRCLQSLQPPTPLGFPALMGILADYANLAGVVA